MLNRKHTSTVLRLNLALALAVGCLVLWSYLREPSEPGSAIFLGFSFLRLLLILIVLFSLLVIVVLLSRALRSPTHGSAFEDLSIKLSGQKGIFWLLAIWVIVSYLSLFLSEKYLGSLASYRESLFPILVWFAISALQFGSIILYLRGISAGAVREYRGVLVSSLVILGLFGLLVLGIAITRLGLTPDQVYWQGPGAPIQLHQVFLAFLAGILFYLFLEHIQLRSWFRLDLVIFFILWVFASLVWLNQSANLTWFSLEPSAPNYQIYPFSDSLLYDNMAREYLIGKPIPTDFWAKPVYVLFLAVLHFFSGGDYALLVSLQVILLAIIPSLVYLLTTRFDARPAGLLAALLFIQRERNALALSDVIQVSHVKLLLSDVFTMGFMILLLWLFIYWLEKPGERRAMPMAFGGVLSLLVLTRGHPIVLLPFAFCIVFFAPFPRSRLRWEAVVLTLAGLILPLLPWLWRNYELTGKLALRYPNSIHSAPISRVYSSDPSGFGPSSLPPKREGELDSAYYQRLQAEAAEFVLNHPDEVARFTSAHFFHNLILSYIYLPYSFHIEDVKEYVRNEPFWSDWQGAMTPQAVVFLCINFSILSLGMGYLWKRYRYVALVPLFLGIGYILSVSVGRISGWRFILPADSINVIYYAVGLMQVFHILRNVISQQTSYHAQAYRAPKSVHSLSGSSVIGFSLLFLFTGLALTHGHGLFSHRYSEKSMSQLKETYVEIAKEVPSAVSSADLDDFLKTDGAFIVYGQALNPSFLKADTEGFDNSWPVYYFWPNYRPLPFSRLIFNVNGPQYAGVVLPMQSPPASFPDGADVIVVGCRAVTGEINALAVLIQSNPPIHYTSESFPSRSCSSSDPG